MNVENASIMARKHVDVRTSQCPQKTRKGICEYPASFTAHRPNQIMCNKQSALELSSFRLVKYRRFAPTLTIIFIFLLF